MKLAARLSTVVIGLLAAWLAVVQPANAVELGGTPAVIAYTYDSHTRASIPTYTTIERGPPVATEPDTTYNPVGHRSDGASARPDTLVAYGTTTYDVPASPAHIDNNTGTTRRPVEAINEEISSLRSGPVAAKPAVGFAEGLGHTALTPGRLQHGTKNLTKAGVLPAWSGKTSPGIIERAFTPILEHPAATFDHTLGGTRVRGFLGDINGKQVAAFVYKEGPYQGQLASSFVPSANQLKMWGVP